MTFIMSHPTERERIFARQMAVWDMNTLLHDAERNARKAEQAILEKKKAEEAVLQEKKKAEEAVLQEKKKAEEAVLQEKKKGEEAVLQEKKKAEQALLEKKKAEETVLQEKKKAENHQKMIVQKMYVRGTVPEEIAEIVNLDCDKVKQWLSEKL